MMLFFFCGCNVKSSATNLTSDQIYRNAVRKALEAEENVKLAREAGEINIQSDSAYLLLPLFERADEEAFIHLERMHLRDDPGVEACIDIFVQKYGMRETISRIVKYLYLPYEKKSFDVNGVGQYWILGAFNNAAVIDPWDSMRESADEMTQLYDWWSHYGVLDEGLAASIVSMMGVSQAQKERFLESKHESARKLALVKLEKK
ncbi:hypothetical protein QM565_30500 [Geitlerinema splendidum]|nr:hypothetical protein [Geitlerinema splendidum]